jgi:ABC-type Zn uptake system ZnuABC Zn-binding protein ZnuA
LKQNFIFMYGGKMTHKISFRLVGFVISASLLLSACGAQAGTTTATGTLKVVATTTMVGDVVRQVGGQSIQLTVLLPVGADPHEYDPRPQDIAAVADAQLVFASGAGLEAFLQPLIDNAGGQAQVVQVSDGIQLLAFADEYQGIATEEGLSTDPHTWLDPNNVIVWTQNIAAALIQADPVHADQYAANAAAYTQQLMDLDSWIRQQVGQIPPAHRKLVTDHAEFGYFAKQYGLDLTGTIVASFTTGASPSAQEMAKLEDSIRSYGVPAVFVSTTVNPNLADQVAQDTGTKVVQVYIGSLSAAGGPANSYLNLMRYNVSAIVAALK